MARFAVFGDVHGQQDLMYELALRWEDEHKLEIDAVLQVGDFETIRDKRDFRHYYAPQKYHHISDISAYYKGKKKAPFLTAFIGGNHEAWTVLAQHRDGGFVCPDIYYLGRAGTLDIKGVTIGGLTGIFNPKAYETQLPRHPDHTWKYYRRNEVESLDMPLDILLLHEWIPYSALKVHRQHNIPLQFKKQSTPTPTRSIVIGTSPKHVFMGHMHGSGIEARIGSTEVIGLTRLAADDPRCFRIVEF